MIESNTKKCLIDLDCNFLLGYNRLLCSQIVSFCLCECADRADTNILLCYYITSVLFLLLNIAWELERVGRSSPAAVKNPFELHLCLGFIFRVCSSLSEENVDAFHIGQCSSSSVTTQYENQHFRCVFSLTIILTSCEIKISTISRSLLMCV